MLNNGIPVSISLEPEMTVNNPESGLYNYGQMDSIIMKKENVILYYSTESEKHETKTINIRPIL